MKKINNILICFLIGLLLVGCSLGCSQKKQTHDVTMLNFEQWGPDFQLCHVSLGFGRVSVNTDPLYVKTGKQSCKIEPKVWPSASADIIMYFPTSSDEFSYDYSDFSCVERIQIEMYNAESEAKNVSVGLVHAIYDISRFGRTNEMSFTLLPGWNTLYLGIDSMLVNLVGRIDDVKGIYFLFDKKEAMEEPCFYVDDIKLIGRESMWSTEKFPIQLSENEVADFERYYQQYLFHSDCGVKFQIVKAEDYGLLAPSGRNILRVELPEGKNTGLWYNFTFLDDFIKSGALGSMTLEKMKNAYFCYDVYNNSETVINVPCIYLKAGDGSNIFGTGCEMLPKTWHRYSYKLTDVEYNLGGYMNNPAVRFDFEDGNRGSVELFYDNFRIEYR